MNNYWLKLFVSFIFITLLPAIWIASELHGVRTKQAPLASGGVIDLRQEKALSRGEIRLNGEWQLYEGQLLTSDRDAASRPPPLTLSVPGVWNDMEGLQGGLGTATYRLRLLLPKGTEGIYGIHTTNIRMSSTIFVNGKEVGGSGRPGFQRSNTISGNMPYVSYFQLEGDEAEIYVQVANYSYATGGIISPIWFGTQEAIARSREINLFEYWMTAGGFLIPAVFLLLFFRLRRREAPLPQLGGFCVSCLIFVLTHGEKAALALLSLNYEEVLRIQLISSAFVYYFLARYVVLLYPHFGIRLLNRLMLLVTLALTLAGIGLPTSLFSRWEALLLVCSFLSIAYVIYVLVRAILTQGAQTLALAASIQSVMVMLAVYLLSGFGQLENQTFLPYAILVFSASQAYLIVERFSELFRHAERMSERLLRLDERKDEFMLNTSYEIREPLHGIVNLAQVPDGLEGRESQSEERLDLIQGIARRLSYLVDDLIDFNLLNSGEANYDARIVNVQSVVRTVLDMYPSDANSRWVLEKLPERPLLLIADERRLGQIVHNLIAYAMSHIRDRVVRLTLQDENGQVTFAIRAPGIGKALDIEREESEFYATDETAAESAERVRLSVTKRLIELGGGTWRTVEADDDDEMLCISWPAASEAEGHIERHAPSGWMSSDEAGGIRAYAAASEEAAAFEDGTERGAQGSILIVDDDRLGALAMGQLLSDAWVSCRIAESGAEALELLTDAGRFDLVIVDLIMPDISGMELVRRIREHAMLSELPILLLSEGRRQEESLVGFRAGANDILVKPYEVAELKARVGTLLQLRSSIKNLVRTETAFLQAQIKPHFLFNAINTIMTVCRLEPPRAEELLLQLSRYLRGSFDFGNLAQSVPLRSELELVRSYLAIESARFEDRLRVEYDIESKEWIGVPPLSIQPLVENAVRHGIMRKPQGGTIRIRVMDGEGVWQVAVEDDGVGIPPDRLAEISATGGVGLANISRRLRLMYGEQLQIESWPGEGTRVSFIIPKGVEYESDSN
ncbi:response regulator [Paenibacillus oryzisoli]|uniref:response regulator n=1 Tax=Paenibacillus oryzisoli TaxID=1850517 RepID=UPI003D26EF71